LENPAFMEEKFDAVVANPPYSAKWSADSQFNDDERFSNYGKFFPMYPHFEYQSFHNAHHVTTYSFALSCMSYYYALLYTTTGV
jgi:23S rRNA G2445 N2-methylase RlmL